MAAPPTAWRAQKSVWQLSKPLGEPKNPYGNSANHLADLKNPYGSSANHLASPKIRMAAPPTTWRAQKSVWRLRQPLGGPKNPYGSSANHLASPKIRMAILPGICWITKKSRILALAKGAGDRALPHERINLMFNLKN